MVAVITTNTSLELRMNLKSYNRNKIKKLRKKLNVLNDYIKVMGGVVHHNIDTTSMHDQYKR